MDKKVKDKIGYKYAMCLASTETWNDYHPFVKDKIYKVYDDLENVDLYFVVFYSPVYDSKIRRYVSKKRFKELGSNVKMVEVIYGV